MAKAAEDPNVMAASSDIGLIPILAATEIVTGPSRATVPLFDMSSDITTARRKKPAIMTKGPVVVERPANQSARIVVTPVLSSAAPSANYPAKINIRLKSIAR